MVEVLWHFEGHNKNHCSLGWNNALTNSYLNIIWMKFQAGSYYDIRGFEGIQRATEKDARN